MNLDLKDVGASLGAKGTIAGWTWDLSDTYGYSKGDYRVGTSVNTSLGAASPTRFHGGGARYSQNLVNLTLDRGFEVPWPAPPGGAGRVPARAIAWSAANRPRSPWPAREGFPGFNPPTPVDVSRHAVSAFVDGELSLIEGLDLGLAGRYEDYSDFGSETTGKASIFWRPHELVALRATASTGIRAPRCSSSSSSPSPARTTPASSRTSAPSR